MTKDELFKKLMRAIECYAPYDFWVPSVGERDLEEFEEDYAGHDFDHKIVLADGGTVFVMLGPPEEKRQVFASWHFGPDGRFIDYVERAYPPEGIDDYAWIKEVCTASGNP